MSNNLIITKENALKAIQKHPESREMLQDLFQGQLVERDDRPITEKVKTFDDALQLFPATEDQIWLLSYKGSDKEVLAAVNFMKASIICQVLNEGWIADYSNDDQDKYEPIWEYQAGVGLSFYHWTNSGTDTGVGARQAFKTIDLLKYACTQ